jgi:hypothetical protein
MRAGDDAFKRLRAALDDLALADADELLIEARAQARARVRSMLSDALADAMLERVSEQLELPSERRPRPSQPSPPRAPAPAKPAPETSDSPLAWYVYGVIGADASASVEALTGIDPAHPVAVVQEGDLAAVTSHVALADFDEARLREHLADIVWVETTARAHEAVLDEVCRRTTLIPMRMCTVYRTEEGVREMLRRDARALADALAHLEGRREWGVKVFAEPSGARPADAPAPDASGAAYMARRRRERDQVEHVAEALEEAAGQIDERLRAVADEAAVVPPQRPEASGHPGVMVLNGVYLVSDVEQDRFHAEVRALQAEYEPMGLEIEPTGPWPAYNFVPGAIGAGW